MSEQIVVIQLHEQIAQLKAQLERMTAMYECEKAEKTALRNYVDGLHNSMMEKVYHDAV